MTAADLFKKVMEDHGIDCGDGQDILDAVSDLFEALANDTKNRYPYATKTIDRYESVSREISTLRLEDAL